MECCVCLESIPYYSYRMDCPHDLCEKCAYQIFDANSKNIQLLQKHKQACYLSCPLCRTETVLKIGERHVYYFDNMINLSSISETMQYIYVLYGSREPVPYVMIMYPDKECFILDPKTCYIYSAYGEKHRIGRMKTKRVGNEVLQTSMVFHYRWYVYLRDIITCTTLRLRF